MGYFYDWFKEAWRSLFRVPCPDCDGMGFRVITRFGHATELYTCTLCRGKGRV